MGKRTIVLITDDHTGNEVPEDQISNLLLTLTQDGHVTTWKPYLTPVNTKALRELIAKFLPHVEEPTTEEVQAKPQSKTTRKAADPNSDEARAWAKSLYKTLPRSQWDALKISVPKDRGRVAADIMAAFYREYPEKRPEQLLLED